MKITREQVVQTAELARLEITEDELDRFIEQLGRIINYIDALNELDTTGIEPTSHVLELTSPMREDKVVQELDTEEILRNAPESDGKFFLVPKVIDNE